MSKTAFYGSASMLPYNNISDHNTEDSSPQITIFILFAPFKCTFLHLKVYYFAPFVSAFSDVKPDISKSEKTFHNDVRFVTVYQRLYCHKFSTLSNQT